VRSNDIVKSKRGSPPFNFLTNIINSFQLAEMNPTVVSLQDGIKRIKEQHFEAKLKSIITAKDSEIKSLNLTLKQKEEEIIEYKLEVQRLRAVSYYF